MHVDNQGVWGGSTFWWIRIWFTWFWFEEESIWIFDWVYSISLHASCAHVHLEPCSSRLATQEYCLGCHLILAAESSEEAVFDQPSYQEHVEALTTYLSGRKRQQYLSIRAKGKVMMMDRSSSGQNCVLKQEQKERDKNEGHAKEVENGWQLILNCCADTIETGKICISLSKHRQFRWTLRG